MIEFTSISPKTTKELLDAIRQNQDNELRFGAGYTDLILELQTQNNHDITVLNLAKLKDEDFTAIEYSEDGLRIGALTTMVNVLSNENTQKLPVLIEAVESLASSQIRAVATVGGNICTASPAGDVSCALVALKAMCEIMSAKGEMRIVPLDQFFTGVKTTVLKKDEILRSVLIPHQKSAERLISGFKKIGIRNSMEIALASFAYHITAEDNGVIFSAGAAAGSVAETIRFTESACEYILGKNLDQLSSENTKIFADHVLEYANPISDVRASAWYRRQVLWNISKSIF